MKMERANIFVILMTIAGALAVAGLIVFLVLPSARELDELSEQIVAAETEVRAQYENRRNLLDVISRLKQTRASVDTLTGQFLPIGKELDFITTLETIGEKNGVSLTIRLDVNAPPTGDFGRAFDVALTGTYAGVMTTIVDIERMPTLVALSALTINQSSVGEDGTALISASIHGELATPPKDL